MNEDLRTLLDDLEHSRQVDAVRYKRLDDNKCMLCEVRGYDKRSFFVECFYNVKEMIPEAIDMVRVDESHRFFLRLCKHCRGIFLEYLKSAAEACKMKRGQQMDEDGNLLTDDPERNIPVRQNGALVWMTREEFDAFKAEHDRLHRRDPAQDI